MSLKDGNVRVLIFEILFWVSIGLVSYTYFIYPVILILLARIQSMNSDEFPSDLPNEADCNNTKEVYSKSSLCNLPTVSVIIPAYNEEKVIQEKLINSMKLEYPKDKIEILVGSDGSTDRTNEIIRKYEDENIKLHVYNDRRGKASILNRLVKEAKGDILVFSDANTIYSPHAVRKLVAHFSDPEIGCVSGELKYRINGKNRTEEGLYWKYEVMLKSLESKFGSVLGANGGIYALRKKLFYFIPEDTILDDFVIGMKVKEQGYNVIFEPNAFAYEDAPHDLDSEITRRIRISAGNYQSINLTKKLLNPKRGFVAFAYWSHKVLRWLVPFFLILAFLSNLFLLDSQFYQALLTLQIIFLFLGISGYMFDKKEIGNIKILNVLSYFASMNLALFLGFFKFITKTQSVTWKRTKR